MCCSFFSTIGLRRLCCAWCDHSYQNVDCILKLAIKDLEFYGPFIPVGKGLQRFLGQFDIHVLPCRFMVPSPECFNINLAIVFLDLRFDARVCTRGFQNVACDDVVHRQCIQIVFFLVCGAANIAFLYHVNGYLWSGTEF